MRRASAPGASLACRGRGPRRRARAATGRRRRASESTPVRYAPWRAPASLSELIDLPDVPLDAAVRSYLPSLELVVADLAGPELTREALRASDAEPVSETLLEILQGASGPEASALFDEWTARLRPLQGEPAGGSTLCAVLCYLTHVSAIPRPRISAAAEALPEPEKETFMTAAQEWMLEGLEKGLQQGLEQGRQEGERAVGSHPSPR